MDEATLDGFIGSLTRLRDLAVFLLMLDGGLRPGEVLSLHLDDISGRRRLTVRMWDDHPRGARGESRTERIVDLHESRTLDAVSRYVMHVRPLEAANPFVFPVGGNSTRRLGPPRLRTRLARERQLTQDALQRGWPREVERHNAIADRISTLLAELGEATTFTPTTAGDVWPSRTRPVTA
jgi:integrase